MKTVALVIAMFALSTVALAFPPLPGMSPSISTPMATSTPDPRPLVQLCTQDAKGVADCAFHQRVSVGASLTLVVKAASLPASVAIESEGKTQSYKVDPTTGSLGTYIVTNRGRFRFSIVTTPEYRGGTLMLMVF